MRKLFPALGLVAGLCFLFTAAPSRAAGPCLTGGAFLDPVVGTTVTTVAVYAGRQNVTVFTDPCSFSCRATFDPSGPSTVAPYRGVLVGGSGTQMLSADYGPNLKALKVACTGVSCQMQVWSCK